MKKDIVEWYIRRFETENQSISLYEKRTFPLRISLVHVSNPQKTVDLFTWTREIHNRKLHFFAVYLKQSAIFRAYADVT